MKEFNTSGPNIPKEHYTIIRTDLIEKGIKLVNKSRYFTIWAPRQTGKSTFFRQLARELNKQNFNLKLSTKSENSNPEQMTEEKTNETEAESGNFLYDEI